MTASNCKLEKFKFLGIFKPYLFFEELTKSVESLKLEGFEQLYLEARFATPENYKVEYLKLGEINANSNGNIEKVC